MYGNIQHPDITAAEATGYPRSRPSIPDRRTVERGYIRETIEAFALYCMGKQDLVEDYLTEHRTDYQDFQWEVYGEVAY